eukprot:gene10143-2562_t
MEVKHYSLDEIVYEDDSYDSELLLDDNSIKKKQKTRKLLQNIIGICFLATGLFILFLLIFLVISVLILRSETIRRNLKVATSYCAKRMCQAAFIQQRNYTSTIPYLEELEFYPYFVEVSVNKEKKTVETRIRFMQDPVSSTFYHTPFGCVDRKIDFQRNVSSHKEDLSMFKFETNEKIQKQIDEEFSNSKINTRSIIVFSKGKILGEKYTSEFSPNSLHLSWSLSKSLLNCLYGLRSKEGFISLSDKVNAPEWKEENDPRRELIIEDLFRMASGLQFSEVYSNPLSDVVQMLFSDVKSYASFAADRPLIYEPKKVFFYATGTSNILSRRLRETFNSSEEYWNYPYEFFKKLGMNPRSMFETDAVGDFAASSFAFLSSRDYLKLGLLYLQNGVWNGEQLFPVHWVNSTTTGSPESSYQYGLHWWVESDLFAATGNEGQVIVVHPKSQTVIVRNGFTPQGWKYQGFTRKILKIIEEIN